MTADEGRVRRALNGDRSLLACRAFPLAGIEIDRSRGADGRTVTAYAAVFGDPVPITDADGVYDEEIAPGAFDKTLAGRSRQVGVFYNHAKTLQGTPSEMASVPIGSPLEIRADGKGLLTVTRYNNTQLASDVLDAIKNGDIRGQSFTGVFLQSAPDRPPYYPDRSGSRTLVTRQEIALIEYGPTPIPAYANAEIVGVRNREGLMAEQERAGGPQPYERGPDESVQCPQCGKYDEPDAVYCDQCGSKLPDSAFGAAGRQPYERHPGEDVMCPNCGCCDMPDAIYCDQCGQPLPSSAYADYSAPPDLNVTPGRAAADGMAAGDEHVPYDPDGDGDDDSTPEGDTDHDYWDADGNQIRDLPGKPLPAGRAESLALAGHFGWPLAEAEALEDGERALLLASLGREGHERAGGVDNSAWDASRAWHNGTQASDPAAFYRGICAGQRSGGDPKTQAHWALPHHYHPSDPPNAAGVRNSLSRLPQTDGLVNKQAAQAHLDAHMRAIHGTAGDSGSGRAGTATDPATTSNGTGEAPAAAAEPPARHSDPTGSTERGTSMPEGTDDRYTVEEREQRVAEIHSRLREIDTEHSGGELPEQARAEWNGLQEELVAQRAAIKDARERAAYLQSIADLEGGSVPGADRNYTESTRTGVAPGQRTQLAPQRTSGWQAPAPVTRDRIGNLYDLTEIRSNARSIEEVPAMLRDRALRSLEQARFHGVRDRSREDVQADIERLLVTCDDMQGNLAKRMLLTGSPTYMRAFGKAVRSLSTNGLTGEESRALSMGNPVDGFSSGSYPVPYQLDPTVTLTSNGAINPLRQIARVEQIVGKEWLGVTSAGVTVTRGDGSGGTGEGVEVNDTAPTLVQPGVAPVRLQAFVGFSVEVEQDWNGLLAEISMMIADAKDVEEASSFVTGDGTDSNAGGVVGSLSTAVIVKTAATATTAIADLYKVEDQMAPRFRPQASWLASKTAWNAVRYLFTQQASAAGDPYVRPSMGQPAEFLGYPAYEASAMDTSTTTSGKKIMLMGDFKQFLIVDRIGMSIELVPHLFATANNLPSGQRGILALWRNNSKVLVEPAFRLLEVL